MAIKRLPDGTLLFDTAVEVAEYERAAAHLVTPAISRAQASTQTPPSPRTVTVAVWAKVGRVIEDSALNMLTAIHASGRAGITKSELLQLLGVDGKGFGGVRGGLSKNLKKLQIDPASVITESNGKYYPGKTLLEMGVPR